MRLKLNSAGIRKVLDDTADAECRPRAEAGAERARASAPVVSGEYRSSIRVWSEENPTRKVWRYGSDAPHAGAVEANSGNLARAL